MRYIGDPHWLQARFSGSCKRCGEEFDKGERIFYYPKGKAAYFGACADQAAAEFYAAAADEAFYAGGEW